MYNSHVIVGINTFLKINHNLCKIKPNRHGMSSTTCARSGLSALFPCINSTLLADIFAWHEQQVSRFWFDGQVGNAAELTIGSLAQSKTNNVYQSAGNGLIHVAQSLNVCYRFKIGRSFRAVPASGFSARQKRILRRYKSRKYFRMPICIRPTIW
jgi:hypothetical protein